MGDPKLQKKKYAKPAHPWQKERILDEVEILKGYGLKNKREIWKAHSLARTFARQAKKLIAATGAQAELEQQQLFERLSKLGIVGEHPTLDDVLGIDMKHILERRLQTIVYKKKLARSVKQSRQFIVHERILIGNKKIKAPSYLVSREEEALVCFDPSSTISNPEHAERAIIRQVGPDGEQIPEKKRERPHGDKRRRMQRREGPGGKFRQHSRAPERHAPRRAEKPAPKPDKKVAKSDKAEEALKAPKASEAPDASEAEE
jgi:small subunit ribosomal protein S4